MALIPVPPFEPAPPVEPTLPVEPVPVPTTPPPTLPLATPPVEAPPSVGGGGGLGDASTLALFLIILGLIAAALYVANIANDFKRLFFGKLPRSVQPRDITQQQATQIVSGRLGSAYSSIDAQVAAGLQQLEQSASGVGAAVVAAEQRIHRLAALLAAQAGLRGADAAKTSAALAGAHTAAQRAAAATAAASAEVKRATAAEAHLQTELSALPSHVHALIEPELEALRHRIHTLERGAAATWDEVTQHAELLGAAATIAAVGTALGGLGAGWVRCESNRLLGEAACEAGPNAARNLLSVLLGVGVLLNLREYVRLEQSIAHETVAVVKTLLRA